MRFFSILFLSTAVLLCLGFSMANNSSKNPSALTPSEKDSLLALIQGDWRCVDISYRNEPMYETCCNEPYLGIHILNDTIFQLDYPHQLYYYGSVNTTHMVLAHDTLIIGNKYYYKRQESAFDPAILKLLKTDTINPASLIGTWELDTWREMGYEGEENYDGTIHFPFKLNKTLTFTKKTAGPPLLKRRRISIPVNGVNKSCYIVSINEHRMTLYTGSWYKPGFEFDYVRKS